MLSCRGASTRHRLCLKRVELAAQVLGTLLADEGLGEFEDFGLFFVDVVVEFVLELLELGRPTAAAHVEILEFVQKVGRFLVLADTVPDFFWLRERAISSAWKLRSSAAACASTSFESSWKRRLRSAYSPDVSTSSELRRRCLSWSSLRRM
jgi:hypothetical protein